jgi:aspartate kinase
VSDARHLPELDYAMMQEMSECGAKVLNAQAVEWAKRHRVVIHARRTTDRWSAAGTTARETVVGGLEQLGSNPRAVVTQQKLALITAPADAAGELLAKAEASGLGLRDAALEAGRFIACLPLLNAPDFPRIRDELRAAIPGLDVEEELGSVSLVGTEIGGSPRTVAAALSELRVRPIFMLSTPLRLSCVIPERALDASEQAWHARFVGDTPVIVKISA